jgi:hypothetical protein
MQGVRQVLVAQKFRAPRELLDVALRFPSDIDRLYAIYFFTTRKLGYDPSFQKASLDEVFARRRTDSHGFALFMETFLPHLNLRETQVLHFPCMVKDRTISFLSPPDAPVINHTAILAVCSGIAFVIDPWFGSGVLTRKYIRCPNDNYFMRPLADCLADYYDEEIAPSFLLCVPFQTFLGCPNSTRLDFRCESHQQSRFQVDAPFVRFQFSYANEFKIPKPKIAFYQGNRKQPIAAACYTSIEIVESYAGRVRIFVFVFFPFPGLFEFSICAPHRIWTCLMDVAIASPFVPFLYPHDGQVIPMQPLTRRTTVTLGCIVVRFAALNNFDRIDVRGRQTQQTGKEWGFESTKCMICDFEIFPINFCHDRQQIFAVVSFTKNGQYRVDFDFIQATTTVASIPYFFDVTGASEFSIFSADAVLPKTLVFQPLPTNSLVSIDPCASKIVTLKQSEEVSVTAPPGRRLAVNLRDREGRLARCLLKERIDKGDCVVHKFVLLFPTYGQFSLAVYLDMNLVFNQRYAYIDARVESDPTEEEAIQNALAQRIDNLSNARLLVDIPESVETLVRSWI